MIVGRQDAWSPPAQHQETAALIPQAQLTVIEGSGYMSPVEQPQAAADALLAWTQVDEQACIQSPIPAYLS